MIREVLQAAQVARGGVLADFSQHGPQVLAPPARSGSVRISVQRHKRPGNSAMFQIRPHAILEVRVAVYGQVLRAPTRISARMNTGEAGSARNGAGMRSVWMCVAADAVRLKAATYGASPGSTNGGRCGRPSQGFFTETIPMAV